MDTQPDYTRVIRICLDLIQLRRRGIIFGVWCDNFVIRIKRHMWSDFELLPYSDAEELIQEWKPKPPQSVIITHAISKVL